MTAVGVKFTPTEERRMRLYRYGFWKQYLCEWPGSTYADHRKDVEHRKFPCSPGDRRYFSLGSVVQAARNWTDGGMHQEAE